MNLMNTYRLHIRVLYIIFAIVEIQRMFRSSGKDRLDVILSMPGIAGQSPKVGNTIAVTKRAIVT